jgi:hypothetical protein
MRSMVIWSFCTACTAHVKGAETGCMVRSIVKSAVHAAGNHSCTYSYVCGTQHLDANPAPSLLGVPNPPLTTGSSDSGTTGTSTACGSKPPA